MISKDHNKDFFYGDMGSPSYFLGGGKNFLWQFSKTYHFIEFWTLDDTSRRLTDFTAALTPRGLVFCNDFWMPFGCVGEHSRCCVDIHVVICSGYDNIFVTFNFYLH